MKNPYPEFIIDESSGLTFHNDPHIYYKEGYEAKEKEDQELYDALKDLAACFRNIIELELHNISDEGERNILTFAVENMNKAIAKAKK